MDGKALPAPRKDYKWQSTKYQFCVFLRIVFAYYHEFGGRHWLWLYDSVFWQIKRLKNKYLSLRTNLSTASTRPPCFILIERFEALDCLWLLFTCFKEPALWLCCMVFLHHSILTRFRHVLRNSRITIESFLEEIFQIGSYYVFKVVWKC